MRRGYREASISIQSTIHFPVHCWDTCRPRPLVLVLTCGTQAFREESCQFLRTGVSQSKAKAHTHKGQTAQVDGREGRAGGAGYISRAAGLSGSPETYLAVCLFGMSGSILSSWLSTSVITLMLGNSRKQTPLQSLASQVARWGFLTPGMPGWAHPRLWQSTAKRRQK